jgi:hypothetical protein
MKKLFYLAIVFFLICNTFSCKKSSASATTVEYQITPMNQYFTLIKYNDNSGNPVSITDPSQFTNGAKTISVTTKPFNAKLEAEINNTTAATITFTLVIIVNGQIKGTKQVSSPPMTTSSNSLEYSVQ